MLHLVYDAVVGDDGQVLLVSGDVGDSEADGGQHLHNTAAPLHHLSV